MLLAAAVALTACSRPEPPTLTPELAKVTAISAAGIDLQVRLEAYNPNSVELSARSMKANVKLNGKYDVGTVTVPTPLALPPKKRTKMDVPLSVKWRDLSGIAALAANQAGVPYEVDGTVSLGGDTLNVDVPFHMGGTVTRDQLMRVVASSLPQIPGLQ